MSDDSTPPTEHGRPLMPVLVDEVTGHVVELPIGISEKDLRLIDAHNHELALDESDDARPNTAEEDADDQALFERAQRRMRMSPEEVTRERRDKRR